jgi:hypothetical protein
MKFILEKMKSVIEDNNTILIEQVINSLEKGK